LNWIKIYTVKMADIAKAKFIRILDIFLNLHFVFLLSLFFTNYSFVLSFLHSRFNFPLKDISNISPQVLIFSFILLIRYILNRETFRRIKFIRILSDIGKLGDRPILIIIFIIFSIIFISIGIARHYALSSSGIDFGVTVQALWNTTKGDILFSSLDGNINHLGSHFEPILFLIAPFYYLFPSPVFLIILQSLALGLAFFPLYLIAKHVLNSQVLIFAFIICYFLSQAVRGIGLLDFHTDVFLVPLIFFTYYSLVKNRMTLAFLLLFLMLLCKEDVTLIAVGFGIFLWIAQRRYISGSFLVLAGILGWHLETNIIMPYFAHTEGYPYLAFLPFGETYAENIKALVDNPFLLKKLFFSSEKIDFYLRLFGPLGFLSFLSPVHYILFAIPLLEHIIGSIAHTGMQTISSHYPAHTMPFIFIAAIYGARRLIRRFSKNQEAKPATYPYI